MSNWTPVAAKSCRVKCSTQRRSEASWPTAVSNWDVNILTHHVRDDILKSRAEPRRPSVASATGPPPAQRTPREDLSVAQACMSLRVCVRV